MWHETPWALNMGLYKLIKDMILVNIFFYRQIHIYSFMTKATNVWEEHISLMGNIALKGSVSATLFPPFLQYRAANQPPNRRRNQ